MQGLNLLQDAIGKEKRPLSWVIGPQGIERPARDRSGISSGLNECVLRPCAVRTRFESLEP